MTVPPIASMPMMGEYALVMMASGTLKQQSKHKTNQPSEPGRRAAPIANPIPKRAMNAAVIAAELSGKLMGSIMPMSITAKYQSADHPKHES